MGYSNRREYEACSLLYRNDIGFLLVLVERVVHLLLNFLLALVASLLLHKIDRLKVEGV